VTVHSELPIHKIAYDLLGLTIDLVKNMPRDVKPVIGFPMRDQCVNLSVLIQRANTSRNKVPHLDALIEGVGVIEVLMRTSREKHYIATKHYAAAIKMTTSISKQAIGWRKSQVAAPAA
jgi:hypothetical protein